MPERPPGKPGPYTEVCQTLKRDVTQADAVAIFVVNGLQGTAWCVAGENYALMEHLANQFEHAAEKLREELAQLKREMN